MKQTLLVILLLALLPITHLSARNNSKARAAVLENNRGYYKELFMDGGIALNSRKVLPATDNLGIKMDFYASSINPKLTAKDTLIQQQIFCGSSEDSNGWLLYPDGAPRYRVIYVNGGAANKHSLSLGKQGRDRLCAFVAAGGSYVGTCAGAFLASAGSKRRGGNVKFTNIYTHWIYARLTPL